jgi:hypothetical protein
LALQRRHHDHEYASLLGANFAENQLDNDYRRTFAKDIKNNGFLRHSGTHELQGRGGG